MLVRVRVEILFLSRFYLNVLLCEKKDSKKILSKQHRKKMFNWIGRLDWFKSSKMLKCPNTQILWPKRFIYLSWFARLFSNYRNKKKTFVGVKKRNTKTLNWMNIEQKLLLLALNQFGGPFWVMLYLYILPA